MLLLLSLLAADPTAAMMKAAAAHSTVLCEGATCRDDQARSPYRLDPNVAGPADGKTRALATTGHECAITGPTLCTHKPRTVFAATY